MKFQQLRYIVEVANQNMNITEAAHVLFTSQPGISKQVRLLENELGVEIFERNGKHIKGLTPPGKKIVAISREIMLKMQGIRSVADEYTKPEQGVLRIATTNTQARYILPAVVEKFSQRYPNVSLHIHQGSPTQIYDAFLLPCYFWNRSVIVKPDHPLAQCEHLTIEELGKYPLITYTFGFTGASDLDYAFNSAGILPNIVFTATNADIIKTYVRMGLGVGIMASMAHTSADKDLVAIKADHLFRPSMTQIAFKNGAFLRNYMYDFINYFSPHLTRTNVEKAERLNDNSDVKKLFNNVELEVL